MFFRKEMRNPVTQDDREKENLEFPTLAYYFKGKSSKRGKKKKM